MKNIFILFHMNMKNIFIFFIWIWKIYSYFGGYFGIFWGYWAPLEKAREFQKNIYFCFIDYAKAFDCVDHNKLWKILKEMGKFWKRWEYQTTRPASWEICMQVRKQQLELDTEQQTGSKLGKEYVKAVYYHPAYLTLCRVHHEKRWAGWSTSWNQDCWEKYQ